MKKVISSLSVEDLEVLSDMATYLLDIEGYKRLDYYLCTESVVFTSDELAVLKKLKHLHVVEYGK